MQTVKEISIMIFCINIGYLNDAVSITKKLFCGRMKCERDNDNEEFESMGYQTIMSADTLRTSHLISWQQCIFIC
jgi:hypothetical protein